MIDDMAAAPVGRPIETLDRDDATRARQLCRAVTDAERLLTTRRTAFRQFIAERRNAGVSMAALARASNMSRQTLYKIANEID